MVSGIECRGDVDNIIKASAMFFSRDLVFDQGPWVLQLQKGVVDLQRNSLRRGKPSELPHGTVSRQGKAAKGTGK